MYFTWRPIYVYTFYHISFSSSQNEKRCRQKLYRKSKHTFWVFCKFFENRAAYEIMSGHFDNFENVRNKAAVAVFTPLDGYLSNHYNENTRNSKNSQWTGWDSNWNDLIIRHGISGILNHLVQNFLINLEAGDEKTLALFYVTQRLGSSRSSVCERARDCTEYPTKTSHKAEGGWTKRERESRTDAGTGWYCSALTYRVHTACLITIRTMSLFLDFRFSQCCFRSFSVFWDVTLYRR